LAALAASVPHPAPTPPRAPHFRQPAPATSPEDRKSIYVTSSGPKLRGSFGSHRWARRQAAARTRVTRRPWQARSRAQPGRARRPESRRLCGDNPRHIFPNDQPVSFTPRSGPNHRLTRTGVAGRDRESFRLSVGSRAAKRWLAAVSTVAQERADTLRHSANCCGESRFVADLEMCRPWRSRKPAGGGVRDSKAELPPAGFEQPSGSSEKSPNMQRGGAESGATLHDSPATKPPTDPNLARIIEAWPKLSEPLKRGILALVESANQP
jgi:hypothetical protein